MKLSEFYSSRCSHSNAGSFCTGSRQKCSRGYLDRTADRGKICGCSGVQSGCQDCGVCEPCSAKVLCVFEDDTCFYLNYAAHVFAAAVVSHCHDAAHSSAPLQSCEAWLKICCQRLQSQVAAVESLSLMQSILMGAQHILLQGSALVEAPVSLISRFASLTFEEQLAVSSEHQLMSLSVPSGDIFKIVHAAQADLTSIFTRQLIAVQPPKDSESHKVVNWFLDAVKKVSDCATLPLHGKSLQWSAHAAIQGCGPDCTRIHNDQNCLVCGCSYNRHTRHGCDEPPFKGRRGSWSPVSNGAMRVPLHVQEISSGTFKVSLDLKSSRIEVVQSGNLFDINPSHREIGTVITFNITHSSSSTPKVIIGLTSHHPALMATTKVSIGLDLGNLTFIGGKRIEQLAVDLKLAVSISPSVIK